MQPLRTGAAPQVHTLNYVREQAELVLAAAEQEAAGAGSTSQPPTPTPQARADGQASLAAELAGQRGGQPPQQQQEKQQQQQQQQQQRRASGAAMRPPPPNPGRLDDANFPTLAAAAANSTGGRRHSIGNSNARVSPAKPQPPKVGHPLMLPLPLSCACEVPPAPAVLRLPAPLGAACRPGGGAQSSLPRWTAWR